MKIRIIFSLQSNFSVFLQVSIKILSFTVYVSYHIGG